jgi:DNA mismatch repair protein MSH5
MDSSFGDIKNDILDLQKQILISVEEAILNQEVYIYSMASSFSMIDATLSLAKFAIEKRLCRPQLIDDTVLVIKGGRHLLQELTVDTFVPNDTFSSSAKTYR